MRAESIKTDNSHETEVREGMGVMPGGSPPESPGILDTNNSDGSGFRLIPVPVSGIHGTHIVTKGDVTPSCMAGPGSPPSRFVLSFTLAFGLSLLKFESNTVGLSSSSYRPARCDRIVTKTPFWSLRGGLGKRRLAIHFCRPWNRFSGRVARLLKSPIFVKVSGFCSREEGGGMGACNWVVSGEWRDSGGRTRGRTDVESTTDAEAQV
eukprot:1389744-Amorphochlora_amoeboformis.AAC.1